jgi:hypothetical protein
MSAYILDELREEAEQKVHNIRATKAWVLHDKRTRYAVTLLESLKERHGGYVYKAIDNMYVYVAYHLNDLTGLKDPKLEMLLNSLLHADSEMQETQDYAAGMTRTYKFYWYDVDNRDRYMVVHVEARFGADSETCRKVVVGYKPAVEPQPIYKLTCDGEEVQP